MWRTAGTAQQGCIARIAANMEGMVPMKTSARKEKRLMAEHERFGWFGLVRLRDVYEFECYLMQRGWKPCVTLGRSLMRVMRDGRIIEVVWDSEKRQTLTSRYGMVLWYDFQIFEKDKWFEHPL